MMKSFDWSFFVTSTRNFRIDFRWPSLGYGICCNGLALKIMSPSEVLVIRFLFAYLIGEIIHYFIYRKTQSKLVKEPGFWGAGFFLAGNLLFQTIGLQFTTATNSAFLTCLYVVLVPLLSAVLFNSSSGARIYFHVLIALFGFFIDEHLPCTTQSR